jgi:hypothetical protein
MRKKRHLNIFIIIVAITMVFGGCATLNVVPEKTVISPALIKNPIKFSGGGFQPNEPVSIEMVIPQNMKTKITGQSPESDMIGIGVGTADAKGNFEVPMGALTTLNTLFQVGWTRTLTPDFKKARPIPPGKYQILATGVESEKIAKSTLEILAPPKKEK